MFRRLARLVLARKLSQCYTKHGFRFPLPWKKSPIVVVISFDLVGFRCHHQVFHLSFHQPPVPLILFPKGVESALEVLALHLDQAG